jgi:hypothetical protein
VSVVPSTHGPEPVCVRACVCVCVCVQSLTEEKLGEERRRVKAVTDTLLDKVREGHALHA